ncbi:hypothetical protein EDD22DRAFT_846784 [Suillus occidentalis]|nr:hypothetical protein EDD22DRAFT_846784 [Suillus occidentalis]
MAPHLHHVPSSTSTQAQAGGKATAMIKDEDEEKSIEVFRGSGTNADAVRVQLDPQIHPVDIAQFTQFGFDERVKQLANHLGLSASHDPQCVQTLKAMHTAALECAKAEIEGQEVEELYASDKSENDGAGIMSIKN